MLISATHIWRHKTLYSIEVLFLWYEYKNETMFETSYCNIGTLHRTNMNYHLTRWRAFRCTKVKKYYSTHKVVWRSHWMFVLISLLAKHFLYSVRYVFFSLEFYAFSFHGHHLKNCSENCRVHEHNAISIN